MVTARWQAPLLRGAPWGDTSQGPLQMLPSSMQIVHDSVVCAWVLDGQALATVYRSAVHDRADHSQ